MDGLPASVLAADAAAGADDLGKEIRVDCGRRATTASAGFWHDCLHASAPTDRVTDGLDTVTSRKALSGVAGLVRVALAVSLALCSTGSFARSVLLHAGGEVFREVASFGSFSCADFFTSASLARADFARCT